MEMKDHPAHLKRRGHNVMDKRGEEYNPNANKDGKVRSLHNFDYATTALPLLHPTNLRLYPTYYKHYPTSPPKKL